MSISEPIYVDTLGPDDFLRKLTTHEDREFWKGVLAEWKSFRNRHHSTDPDTHFERETNIAVAMLHLGMVGQAIQVLEDLERTNPGRYYTAANLGTAYELNGQNAKARQWIMEGIERNKDSHYGTEWLHLKILDAKLALEKDPNWLANNPVIEIRNLSEKDLLAGHQVAIGNRGKPLHIKDVQDALVYQLHERLEFIKPPEGVVADLLFDLSRTLALTRSLEHSATIASFAQTYGTDLTPWSSSGPFLPAVDLPPPVSTTPLWIAGASAFAVILSLGTFAFVRRRRMG